MRHKMQNSTILHLGYYGCMTPGFLKKNVLNKKFCSSGGRNHKVKRCAIRLTKTRLKCDSKVTEWYSNAIQSSFDTF